ncbi:MAG: hypothetical protein V3W41_02000 [Planctomycetota bacterium]
MGSAEESPRPDSDGPKIKVELSIDGQRLPLKAFLHDVIGGSIVGMVEGLRDPGQKPLQTIEIRVQQRRGPDSSPSDDAKQS